jgi:hypothetical protein
LDHPELIQLIPEVEDEVRDSSSGNRTLETVMMSVSKTIELSLDLPRSLVKSCSKNNTLEIIIFTRTLSFTFGIYRPRAY